MPPLEITIGPPLTTGRGRTRRAADAVGRIPDGAEALRSGGARVA